MYLFFAFLLVPIIEIALFIQVGGAIGLWPTLGIVVLTAVLGAWLVRMQGRSALRHLRSSLSDLTDPTEPLAHGAMILIAGALLLTPGFFTDAVGFCLLVPRFRMAILGYLRTRVIVHEFRMGRGPEPRDQAQGDIIEGEFEEVTPEHRRARRPSGWVGDVDRH